MAYCECPCAGCSGCTGLPEAPRGLIRPEPGSADEFTAQYLRRDTASVVFHRGAGCPGHTTGMPAPECLDPLTSQAGTGPA